eukprot:TRINITY_DN15502_c0_g1_i1.p1 TRINITY_DN15502_c0_g1~~TRINITY_DN15502_c0_g1_i1.p1  ORF type:complete len:222 (+),score=29.94 TRINITY_DN15502_c0_g1_i1:31-666(+)
MKRVIFLDVDGVLHPLMGQATFLESCMNRLKRIVQATGAEIVLSSSWRQSPVTTNMVNKELQKFGISPCISKTPILGLGNRAHEVVAWLDQHKPDRYVVLDDIYLAHHPRLTGHCVHTDSRTGLTDSNEQLAITILSDAIPGGGSPGPASFAASHSAMHHYQALQRVGPAAKAAPRTSPHRRISPTKARAGLPAPGKHPSSLAQLQSAYGE